MWGRYAGDIGGPWYPWQMWGRYAGVLGERLGRYTGDIREIYGRYRGATCGTATSSALTMTSMGLMR
jgi:hypothetical protein